MRQVAKKGLLTAMATGSVLASTAGYAYASGSDAQGTAANSPGVGSGNAVQAPLDIPVNACGNTISVIGLLNPAYGNNCSNGGASGGGTHSAPGSSASGGTAGSPGVASGNTVEAPVSVPVDACGNSVNVVGVGNPAYGNDCGNHSTTTEHPPTTPPGEDCPPEQHGGHNPPPSTQTPPGETGNNGGEGSTGTPRTGGPSVDQPGTTTPGTSGSTVTPVTATGTTGHSGGNQAVAEAGRDQLASTGAVGLELLAPAGALLTLGGGVLYRRSRALAGR